MRKLKLTMILAALALTLHGCIVVPGHRHHHYHDRYYHDRYDRGPYWR
ncbi:Uncharacterised protein [Bordetella ansorpii]|uniref:Uncharacterized protein n=1 Tax=Bordetella ansorpii TaxID=288768 RepID=A0A157SSC0_9BORD|nr:hypothetical protein [Bordetella ansorpii]SAI73201.1 Uncharacterised protein [Bordetella ansorpii]